MKGRCCLVMKIEDISKTDWVEDGRAGERHIVRAYSVQAGVDTVCKVSAGVICSKSRSAIPGQAWLPYKPGGSFQ